MIGPNDGGPAFPVDTTERDGKYGHQTSHSTWQFTGMTLRDYFAAKALPSVVAVYVEANGRCIGTEHFHYNCAAHAYLMADAMLKARKTVNG